MRKIWNFAMAAIVIVASAGLLAACDKDDVGTDNPWSNGEYEFAETDLSFMEVFSSAELWIEDKCYLYSEAGGKGDEYILFDRSKGVSNIPSGFRIVPIAFEDGFYREYYDRRSSFGSLDFNPMYYEDYNLTIDGDIITIKNVRIPDSVYTLRVMAYDENNVLLEWQRSYKEGYEYHISHYVKNTPEQGWKNDYMSSEEFYKKLEELENK